MTCFDDARDHRRPVAGRRLAGALLVALVSVASIGGATSTSAQTPAPLRFTDWTTLDPNANVGTGSLLGHTITLAGTRLNRMTTDGTFESFDTPYFTPQLPHSDMVEFAALSGYSYTLDLGAPTQDPVLDLFSLGSTLTFPAGTQIAKLSGDLTVSDNRVVGLAPNDVNGTVKLAGVFTEITFSTTYAGGPPDGIDLQVGGRTPTGTATPGTPAPLPTPTPTVPAPPKITSTGSTLRIPLKGGFKPPPGFSHRQACRGRVTVKLNYKKHVRLGFKTVKLNRRCRWHATFRVRRSRLHNASFVRYTARFGGNRYLRAVSTTRPVRIPGRGGIF